MFEDVRQAGVIDGRGGEVDGEEVFVVLGVQMEQPRAGFDVFELVRDAEHFGQRRDARDGETAQFVADGQDLAWHGWHSNLDKQYKTIGQYSMLLRMTHFILRVARIENAPTGLGDGIWAMWHASPVGAIPL